MQIAIPLATFLAILCGAMIFATPARAAMAVDETPAAHGQWGFRPADGATSTLNPPRFAWRPQKGAKAYVVEAARDRAFRDVAHRAAGLPFNVYAPPKTFEPGKWYWRFRFVDGSGNDSAWSTVRAFELPPDATRFPLPPRDELLARVPAAHPRLFVRPEEMPKLRERAKSDLKPHFDRLIKAADAILSRDVPTDEPPLYPPGTKAKSEQWRQFWWGARDQTMRTLEPAAQLGFAYQISGDEKYGREAKRILLAAANWDPHGASGYRYNDEAGMPFNYLFARTYSFVHDLLSEHERAACRAVMAIRGREMYEHLCPSHFWTPYKSHQNRAWHFLGEVAVAFRGEIPEADDWLWFAMNVFANVYPVWNDADGGWHEGSAYWASYLGRFSWWADVMHAAVGIDAYKSLPFFERVGYLPIYAMPPGTPVGGFGDQTNNVTSANMAPMMAVFAAQAQNPHWQWYADAHEGIADAESAPEVRGGRLGVRSGSPAALFSSWRSAESGYIPFLRAARYPKVDGKPPTDLPSSRAFRGVGQAYLNTTLLDARDNVEVLFKSSPFGTQSHGYDAQNSFQLYAFGQPLLVSSGVRDLYGSSHHANWMWATKSCNNITVGKQARGQVKHSPAAIGQITAFSTSPDVDFVQGDASQAYAPPLRKFTRGILFAKPDVIVIVDELETDVPEVFQYRLHSPAEMRIAGPADISISTDRAGCHIGLFGPDDLELTQTDEFDAPPRERIKLTQYHLTAATTTPAAKQRFIALIRPHRADEQPAAVTTRWADGNFQIITGDGRQITVDRHGSIRYRRGEERTKIFPE